MTADAARGALAGWQVLVPRGGEWGDKVVRLLAGQGATGVVVPLIDFAPPADPRPLDEALAALRDGAYAWVLVTSGTTVPSLAARAPDVGALLGTVPVAAVGPGTGRALARLGVVPTLVPHGERSARGLLAEMPAPPPGGGRVLLPHSDIAETALADGLRAAGWDVDDVVAYRTVPGPPPDPSVVEDVVAGRVDAVLLSSASTVTALLELVGRPPGSTVVCCIGPRTEEAARAHGLTVHVVPPAAAAEDLVEALARHARAHGRARDPSGEHAPDHPLATTAKDPR